jgi:hypothetical protein
VFSSKHGNKYAERLKIENKNDKIYTLVGFIAAESHVHEYKIMQTKIKAKN